MDSRAGAAVGRSPLSMMSFRRGGVSHKNRADKAGRGGITFKRKPALGFF
jgi:hypothetical protein